IKNSPFVTARVTGRRFHAGDVFRVIEVQEENRKIRFLLCQGITDSQLRVYLRPSEVTYFEPSLFQGD
ncbi:MAG TPA: hypothetical protein VKZ59_13135, partial [Acidobacteriota bacterium]|nr:hypothetical protein [Acidobacteriota bacterium]